MRTKKLALAATALLLTATGLSACSSSDAGSSSANATTPKDTKATITIWSYAQPKFRAFLDDAAPKLKKYYPNITVQQVYVPYDQITSKMLGTAVSGGTPDGIVYNPIDAANLSQSGVLKSMNSFWEKYPLANEFPKAVVWKNKNDVVSIQGYVNTTALYYNKDILDKVGVKPPTTVDELESDLAAVKAAGYTGMTMSAAPTAESEFQFFPWLLSEGQNYGKFDTATVKDVFARFSSWIAKGYLPRDIVGYSQGDAWDKWSGGQTAFTQNGNWNLGNAKDIKFHWGVVQLPAGKDGSHSIGGGEGASIGAKTKYADVVWQYFRLALFDKDAQLHNLKLMGAIPVASSLSKAPEIAQDKSLATFAKVVANEGSRPSTPKMANYLVEMGKIWNGVAGGQLTPDQAATKVHDTLNDVKP